MSVYEKYRKLWALLPRPFHWAAIALVAASVVGSVLEVLGIALLGLLLSELGSAGGPAPASVSVMQALLPDAGDPTGRVRLVLALCAAVFVGKNLFLAVHAWAEATFVYRLQARISDRLVAGSLLRDYEQASRRSASEYTSLLTADLSALAHYSLLPSLTLLSELVLSTVMFLYLVSTQTVVTLVIAAALISGGLAMSGASRAFMGRLSSRRQALEDGRLRQLQQTFGNLRDVYIFGAARNFQGVLRQEMAQIADVYRGYQMLSTGPRLLLESSMVVMLLAMIAVGLQSNDRGTLVASVGVFAASGFRFLIGANRMLMSLQAMRFGEAALARVWDTLEEAQGSMPRSGDAHVVEGGWIELQAKDVQYRHAGSALKIGPLNLCVRRGEIVGIVGSSGVGKSTVLEILGGLRRPESGTVVLNDCAGSVWTVRGPGPSIGLVGQSTGVLAASLRENVAFGLRRDEISDDAIWEALRLAQIEAFAREMPEQLDTPLAELGTSLSGGQLQRIGIARALCRHSSFMLLDEPTSALDPATELELVRTLRQISSRCGIVLVSHRSGPLHACDRVYELGREGLQLVGGLQVHRESAGAA